MSDSTTIEQLKRIKEALNNQQMSCLVGAGFSMNVSDKFLSWPGLLEDMVRELYGDKMEESYALSKIDNFTTMTKEEYLLKKSNQIMAEIGYLEIVSEYVRRKGFEEAIAIYIEKRTPKINREFDELYLYPSLFDYKRQDTTGRLKLKEEDISQHRALIQLPWNNIYTTNYDELLEQVGETYKTTALQDEISKIDNNILDCVRKESATVKKITEIEESLGAYKKEEDESFRKNSISVQANIFESDKEKGKKLKELESENAELFKLKEKLKDFERKRFSKNEQLKDSLTLVEDSSNLELRRNKNIIKIHGSLRSLDKSFGFDSDNRKHYVISKEHYETYAQKHEAFTQLMRIALLQESFCLIGFSGDDPNFIGWIRWVRDILECKIKENHQPFRRFKVYFIDMNTEALSPEKELFFMNHQICRISILNLEVTQFLEEKTNINISSHKKKMKKALEALFKYLSLGNEPDKSKSDFEVQKVKEYNEIWGKII